jgi:hypothetical protein
VSPSGVITLDQFVPAGNIHVATDWEDRLRPAVEVCARHAHDGETLLVPGIPECDDEDVAIGALIAFSRRIDERLLRSPRRGGKGGRIAA